MEEQEKKVTEVAETIETEEQQEEKKERKHPIRKLNAKLNALDDYYKDMIKTGFKIAGIAALAICLIIACSVSVINRRVGGKRAQSGTMISISEVSYGVDPFYGVTFGETPYSYNDMLYGTYSTQEDDTDEFDQRLQELLADYKPGQSQSHVTEAEITTEEVASADTDEEKPAEPEVVDIDAAIAYNKEHNTTQTVIFVPGTAGTGSGTGAAAYAPTGYTYADENGVYQDLGEFVLTAYCPCPICCGQWSNMDNPSTASGNPAVEGVTIAVDTNVIPFGTRIKIGEHIYTAQDRGGAIKGNRIDVYFRTHERACQFGKQTMHVYKVIE